MKRTNKNKIKMTNKELEIMQDAIKMSAETLIISEAEKNMEYFVKRYIAACGVSDVDNIEKININIDVIYSEGEGE